jgi:hypothetical protein
MVLFGEESCNGWMYDKRHEGAGVTVIALLPFKIADGKQRPRQSRSFAYRW